MWNFEDEHGPSDDVDETQDTDDNDGESATDPGKEEKGKREPLPVQVAMEDLEKILHSHIGRSLIEDEVFEQEIHTHLHTLGSYVSAKAIVRFLDNPEMLAHLHRKKTILLTTAQRWMRKMDYRWTYRHFPSFNGQTWSLKLQVEERTQKYGNGDTHWTSLGPRIRRVARGGFTNRK